MAIIDKNHKPDAVIFIPDMGDRISIDMIAERIAVELDRNTLSPEVSYSVQTRGDIEPYPSNIDAVTKERVRTIYRRKGKEHIPVIDLYMLGYAKTLADAWKRQNPLVQSLKVFFVIILGFPRLLRAMFLGKSKKLSEKLQIFYAIFILLLLSFYMLIVLLAVIQMIPQLSDLFKLVVKPVELDQEVIPYAPITVAQVVVILTALIQSFLPDLRRTLLDFAINILGVINYINSGDYKNVIAGRFADLLDYVAAKKMYDQIHVIGYSMGAIVAIDNIFPYNEPPVERAKYIYSLTTIGCVADAIELFFPLYFEDRCRFENVPCKWINVYSPLDVFGSNFRNDSEIAAATRSIRLKKPLTSYGNTVPAFQYNNNGPLPENIVYTGGVNIKGVSLIQWLTLFGVKMHGVYFETKEYIERSSLNGVISKLYEGKPILT